MSDQKEKVVIYTDGSFNPTENVYSWGCYINVLFEDGKFGNIELKGADNNPDVVEMRNIAGELKAVLEAVRLCITRRWFDFTICYDYIGIEKWALGQWKTNCFGSKKYSEWMKSSISKYNLNIEFKKIKAHSGNFGNERADTLATEAMTKYLIERKGQENE